MPNDPSSSRCAFDAAGFSLAAARTITAIAMVKNEQDIIEPFVRHNIRFVDHLLILNNGSIDQTRRILSALAQEFPGLHVSDDESFGYTQSQRMTALLRHAQEKFAADYVLLLDADEFLDCPDREALLGALLGIPSGGCGFIPWSTFVLRPGSSLPHTAPGTDPLQAMTWRRRVERPQLYKAALFLAGSDARSTVILQGNHGAAGADGAPLPGTLLRSLRICHYPVRNRDQMMAKCIVGWMAYLAANPLSAFGNMAYQWRDNFQRIANGEQFVDADLCDASFFYSQDSASSSVDWDNDVVEDRPHLVLERRYSSSQSMSVLQVAARSWQQAILSDAQRAVPQLVTNGRVSDAINLIGAGLAAHETPDLWNTWGALHTRIGHLEQAERGFRNALNLDPVNRNANVNLGLLLLVQKRVDEGMTILRCYEDTLTPEEKKAMVHLCEAAEKVQA